MGETSSSFWNADLLSLLILITAINMNLMRRYTNSSYSNLFLIHFFQMLGFQKSFINKYAYVDCCNGIMVCKFIIVNIVAVRRFVLKYGHRNKIFFKFKYIINYYKLHIYIESLLLDVRPKNEWTGHFTRKHLFRNFDTNE